MKKVRRRTTAQIGRGLQHALIFRRSGSGAMGRWGKEENNHEEQI